MTDTSSTPQEPDTNEGSDELTVEAIVEQLELYRMRYELPNTSAYIRYQAAKPAENDTLQVHVGVYKDPAKLSNTGKFTMKDLVNELEYAYVLVHVFPNEQSMDFYLQGFDMALAQLEFVGGSYDFRRLYINSGISNLSLPVAVFLGERNAVNGQPSVTLLDHRDEPLGKVVYRAVAGAGQHVGEEYFTDEDS